MIPIRALAGFLTGNGIYHNQRTVVDFPMDLQRATPIGKFVFHGIKKVSAANLGGGGPDTAAYRIVGIIIKSGHDGGGGRRTDNFALCTDFMKDYICEFSSYANTSMTEGDQKSMQNLNLFHLIG
jgi:hypothetical protein